MSCHGGTFGETVCISPVRAEDTAPWKTVKGGYTMTMSIKGMQSLLMNSKHPMLGTVLTPKHPAPSLTCVSEGIGCAFGYIY